MFTLVVVACLQTQSCALGPATLVVRTMRDLSLETCQKIAWPVINDLPEPEKDRAYRPVCARQTSYDAIMRVRV